MRFGKEQLFERVLNFGAGIIGIASKLPKTPAGYKIGSQLIGSATSIGANTQEAQDASSKRDFINKMSIALREARETKYWLTLIERSGLLGENEVGNELKESDELCAIYSAIVKKAKSNLSNLKSQISNAKGFTLIELLVVIVVLSIIAGVSSSIFLSVIRSNNKANIINEIQQNGNFVLQSLEATVRNARAITFPTVSGPTRVLEILDKDNRYVSYQITSVGGVGVVQRCEDRQSSCTSGWRTVTNANAVTGISVVVLYSTFNVNLASTPPSVSIILRLTQTPSAPGRIDYQATTNLQTTVSLRDY